MPDKARSLHAISLEVKAPAQDALFEESMQQADAAALCAMAAAPRPRDALQKLDVEAAKVELARASVAIAMLRGGDARGRKRVFRVKIH